MAVVRKRCRGAKVQGCKGNLATAGIAIVDGRNTGFYTGAQTGGGPAPPHKTGHIRGAHSVPFNQTVDEANRLKPAAELQKLFADAARSLGCKVLLYDGSFEDWSRKNYPVDSGGKP